MCLNRLGSHQPTNLQKSDTFLYNILISCFKCEKTCCAYKDIHIHIKDVCTACNVPQPQLMLEMYHLSRHAGGQAVLVRDLHRAGAQEQQHRCVHGDTCNSMMLAAEERILIAIERLDYPEQKDGCSLEKKGSAILRILSLCTLCCYLT